MVTLYGIPNCDTVKKARTWLAEHQIDYHFYDYKKQGIDAEKLAIWCQQWGWENVLNRKGLTYKKLDDATKSIINNEAAAIDYMLKATSSIKWQYKKGTLTWQRELSKSKIRLPSAR